MAFIRAMVLSKPGMCVQKGEEGRVFYAFNHYVDFLDDLGRAKSYIDCRGLWLVLSAGTSFAKIQELNARYQNCPKDQKAIWENDNLIVSLS